MREHRRLKLPGIISGPWRHYLETDPDPIAMVIRVELFTHKPSVTNAWLLMHVTGGYCTGLVDE